MPKWKGAAPPPAPGAKIVATEERRMLGCFSAPLKLGIVGLPKVGKSDLFKRVTLSLGAPTQTLNGDIQTAVVAFPVEEFAWLCKFYNPVKRVWPVFEISDTLGLVRGSFVGEGVGNKFLSQIRGADGILHILRLFEHQEIPHVDGSIDPIRDLDTISEELRIKDSEFITERLNEIEKLSKQSNIKRRISQQLKNDHKTWLKIRDHLRAGNDIRSGDWDDSELEILNGFNLLTAKPAIYMVNMSPQDFEKKDDNAFLPLIHTWVQDHCDSKVIPWTHLPRQAKSMIPAVIKESFKAVNLIFFFSANPQEVKCCQIKDKTKAPQAAGSIDPILEKGFLWAEVMRPEDLKALGSESSVKAAGRCRKVGKTYDVQSGDVIFFKSYLSATIPQ